MTERIGAAVLRDVCAHEEETEALLISLKAIAPSNQLETVQYRLVYMILENLAVQEVIGITPAKDPRLKQAKIDKCIQEHLKGSKSTVSFTKEAIELKKKAQLNADCSECYPGGGLINPKGKNLCFANALLQCMRIADLHRILQYHTACTDEDSCFTCSLKKIMTEGSITAEPVCRKMTSIWSSYKEGQQQDSHELLHIMMQ
ncbi:uncharacterized protein LOC134691173 isoform X1 [Mytilus trossulus]|uniref:uncharacterized protein LOC134691173 isoform X1 n=1 Tax=Mytilus trossulus TaxID=6551 RepID=UPI003005A7AF